jgi:hypothetical protein
MIRNDSFSLTRVFAWFTAACLVLFAMASLHAASKHAVSVMNEFATPADLSAWHMDHPEDWEILKDGDVGYLHMKRMRDPGVPRRPLQFALLKGVDVGSFTLDVKVRREKKSLIVVFNYQDTLHFYYAHVSSDPGSDALPHNGVFIVDGAARRRITGQGSQPALPDQAWHNVKVVRDVDTGTIQVFLDKATTPLFNVVDHTFTHGQVGLGSFDETGDFADFRLKGTAE